MNKEKAIKQLKDYCVAGYNERVILTVKSKKIDWAHDTIMSETRTLLKNAPPLPFIEVERLINEEGNIRIDYSGGIIKYVGRYG